MLLADEVAEETGSEEVSQMLLVGENLIVKGKVTFNDKTEKEFDSLVAQFDLDSRIVDEDDPDVLNLNKKAKRFHSNFNFWLGSLNVFYTEENGF